MADNKDRVKKIKRGMVVSIKGQKVPGQVMGRVVKYDPETKMIRLFCPVEACFAGAFVKAGEERVYGPVETKEIRIFDTPGKIFKEMAELMSFARKAHESFEAEIRNARDPGSF